jgi:hypothetical protein
MDLTVAEVRGFASAGTVKTGNPDFRWLIWPEVRESPFLARSEITAPAEELLAPAISFAAASIESSMSSVVLMCASSHLML